SLAGKLTVAADYNLRTDEVRLETFVLAVDNFIKMQASGTVASLRCERQFKLNLAVDQVDLGTLTRFLPGPERSQLTLGGTLDIKSILLTGNGAQGVTGDRKSV